MKSTMKLSIKDNKIITIGTVEHNGWKFSVMNDGTIKYITPTGEKGFFNDVEI